MTQADQGVFVPIGPGPFARIVFRPLTKVLNPLIVKLAGRKHFNMAAQIRHIGRKSGKTYTTPATAHLHDDVIVIALTFGNQSDWARNVRAAGGCVVRVKGGEYTATNPQLLGRADAPELLKAAFSPMERASFRMLGIRQFMRLDAAPVSV